VQCHVVLFKQRLWCTRTLQHTPAKLSNVVLPALLLLPTPLLLLLPTPLLLLLLLLKFAAWQMLLHVL
jgi:hypothetical protein